MIRIGSVVMHVADIRRATDFWSAALGYQRRSGRDGVLAPASGDGPMMFLDEDDRTHLDLWAANAAEQEAEVARLVSLGATRVEWTYPPDADFVVLADPDGNLFCVVDAGR